MSKVKIELTSFDKLEFPDAVYKYREANNQNHRTILTDQIVFFSQPKKFTDKLDCRIPIRYDLLTDDEILENYYKTLKKQHPKWDKIFLRQEAIRWANLGLLRNKPHIKEIERKYWKEFNERFGVLCLTANPINIEMWNSYSDKFNGFCVGFNPTIMFEFFGSGGIVEYPPTLPIIHPFDQIEYKMVTSTFNKLSQYQFEEEYRVTKFWPSVANKNLRQLKMPALAYKEVIIGYSVDKNVQKEIYAQTKAISPLIEVKLATLNKNKVIIKQYK